MSVLTTVLSVLVAVEFFYIFYLETIATTSKTTSRVFKMSTDELCRKSVKILFKNQGVYNALIGIGLIYGTFFTTYPKEIVIFLLVYVILVAFYGAITSDKSILLKQGGIAILTLTLLLLGI